MSSLKSPASLTDAHCHAHGGLLNCKNEVLDGVERVFIMGTSIEDWDNVEACFQQAPDRVVPGYGTHPWFSSKVSISEHRSVLRERLLQHSPCILGEIGLDKRAKDRRTGQLLDFETQRRLFESQMDLAAELMVPVSVHMVKCTGVMLEILRKRALAPSMLPPRIMLHSFSGSPETVVSILKLPKRAGRLFYFSFSAIFNGTSKLLEPVLRETPVNRILLESDTHQANQVKPAMEAIASRVATVASIDRDWLLNRVQENSRAFLDYGREADEPSSQRVKS